MPKVVTKQYNTVAIPSGLWKDIRQVLQATAAYTSEAEFVREAVREKLREIAVTELNDLPEKAVKKALIDYVKKHGRAYPSDITAELGIPYFTVIAAIDDLVREGLIEAAEEIT